MPTVIGVSHGRTIIDFGCASVGKICPELTATDITRLTGIICRENGYPTPMFGYIHAAMKHYLEVNAEELTNSTGEDILKYFRVISPIAYHRLKKMDMLTIKKALEFRDSPKERFRFP
jgi:hypothetical protein